ncbi:unnamed protein product [Urochloa humidicola]
MGEVPIPRLETGDCTDVICVRASRFWEFYDIHDETKLLHADLVLIDEEGNSIHAQMYKEAYLKFKSAVHEGGVYNLSYFWVKKASNNYTPVINDIALNLSEWTQIEEVVEIPPAFPCITYSLTPIEEVPSRVNYTEYFTDVIGIVTSVSNVMSLRAKGRQTESLKRVVTLRSASNASVDVVLWGERASSFPAEQIQTDGQNSPQVVIFVGTLVKKNYSGEISLTGNAPCRWYINPEVPEAKALLASLGDMNQPIKWDNQIAPNTPAASVEEKKISEIIKLNPFKYKKNEYLVNVTIKKIDSSWWYNACYKCCRTAKPYGNQYRCNEPTCEYIGKPVQRYKLTMIAGDETGDTNFIMFGKLVQRLARKSADTLIAENPKDFIPNEITRLLEKVFKWNVSFTQQTTSSSKLCFQVNAVLGEINDTNSFLPVTPTTSQSSSLMISQGADSSVQRTPQKSVAFPSPSKPTTSLATHASSTTPTKTPLNITKQQLTPQSCRQPDDNQGLAFTTDAPDDSSTKSQKSCTKKRSRPSPDKKVTKKLFAGQDGDDNDESNAGADTVDPVSTSLAKDA